MLKLSFPPLPLICVLAFLPVAAAAAEGLPAAQDDAASRLAASPRHGEYLDVRDGNDTVRAWIVYPERADKAPVVIVIHEIFGLSDWIRAVADQFAAEGFIAIAPDLLSGKGPGGTNTPSDPQEAVPLVRGLDPAEVARRIHATARHGAALPAANGKYGVAGFCWGGGTSFDYAAFDPNLGAAAVYYGRSAGTAQLANVKAPILGLYGEDDARVNATIPEAEAELQRLGRSFEKHIFPGAGHAFLRQQAGRDGGNMEATRKAWERNVAFFREKLE